MHYKAIKPMFVFVYVVCVFEVKTIFFGGVSDWVSAHRSACYQAAASCRLRFNAQAPILGSSQHSAAQAVIEN